MRDAGEIAQHHAEAVVERHGDAQPVLLGQPHRLPDEEAVVQDVVVGQRGALGVARGAAGELDVDGVVELKDILQLLQLREMLVPRGIRDIAEVQHARRLVRAHPDDGPQAGDLVRVELSGLGVVQFRRHVADHADIVAALERRRQDQRLAADLVQRVFKLVGAVCRIDVDQNQPGLGRGELGQHPFGIVLRPDADPVTGLQAQGYQPGRHLVHFVAELAIGPADTLMANDQGVGIGRQCRDTVQMHADRLADQWRRGRTMDIAPLKSGHRISPDHMVFAPAPDASMPACFQGRMTTTICGVGKTTKEKGVRQPVSAALPNLDGTNRRFRWY